MTSKKHPFTPEQYAAVIEGDKYRWGRLPDRLKAGFSPGLDMTFSDQANAEVFIQKLNQPEFGKDKIIEEVENDPDNWMTRRCAVCKDPIRINFKLDPASANLEEPFTCSECLNKD